MALELARAITDGDRSYEKPILFLFFDKEIDPLLSAYTKGSGNYYMRRTELSANGGYSYLELMGTGLKGNKVVDLVAYFGQLDKENSFRSILQMEKILKEEKVPYLRTQNLLPTEGALQSIMLTDLLISKEYFRLGVE